jgi:hypothetical protein
VLIGVPANYSGAYALECKYGDINSDFEYNRIKGESTTVLEGMVGDSSNKLDVKLRSGNISFV